MTPEQERQSAAWMRLAQAGDQDAYASLLVLLTSVTRRFARGRLGGVAWIDDVVQETLMTVHRARATYDGTRPFAPWFYAIASSRLIDAVRRERRITGREIVSEPAIDVAAPSAPDVDIDIDAVRAALRTLPSRQRDIIEGLKFRDESVKDIAGRLDMTVSAVKISAHRGYRKLRALLGVRVKKTKDLRTDQLIVRLASATRAVTPLRPPSVRLGQWMAVTVVLAGLATFAIGPRVDLLSAMTAPAFAASLAFLVVATLGGASAAFVLSVPGAERSWVQRALPVAAVLAWPAVWILMLAGAPDLGATRPRVFHSACAIEILGIAAVSGALLLGMTRRAAPLRPAWTAATVSLAAVAAAAAATQVICPLSDPSHQLFGHALVAAVVGLAGLLIGWRALRQ